MANTTTMKQLKNGFTPLENLKICIKEKTAVAETFEVAISEHGLTFEIIALINQYYAEDIKEWKAESKLEQRLKNHPEV